MRAASPSKCCAAAVEALHSQVRSAPSMLTWYPASSQAEADILQQEAAAEVGGIGAGSSRRLPRPPVMPEADVRRRSGAKHRRTRRAGFRRGLR